MDNPLHGTCHNITGRSSGFGKHISFTCITLVLPADCTKSSCSSTLVLFTHNFLVLYLNNNFLFRFPKIDDLRSSIFDVVTHKL